MDIPTAVAFVREHHRAVLATTRREGGPQLSPVLCSADADGHVLVSTPSRSAKAQNARRDPAVSMCVMSDGFFGEWVQIDGRADVVGLPDAMEGLVDLYRSIQGEHPDWEEFRADMVRQDRVLLRVEVVQAGPDRGR